MTAIVELPGTADLAPAPDDIDGRAATTIRMLAADAVESAQSGHPGLPMGMATAAHVLWSRFLRHDPSCPSWPDRDRFVLSAGHGSMLLYALLHLYGYDLPMDELRAFRQWGSRTPGHPEYGHTVGVETTTGPLGQGLANAVGMALAERMLAARYKVTEDGTEDGTDRRRRLVDHWTYVLASDGDLMEGISHEAASLAGHLGLGRLVVLYDDNGITIDGRAELACSDDPAARFAAYGWHTDTVDGEDADAIEAALRVAVADQRRPSLIAVRTRIGYGAPTRQGTAAAHGAPLGGEELARTRERFGWPADEPFHVPEDVRRYFATLAARGRRERLSWEARLAARRESEPRLIAEWDRIQAGELPADVDRVLPTFDQADTVATRKASGAALRALAEVVPELVGGSADLAESTATCFEGGSVTAGDYAGRTVHFGVREHAMGAVCNGIALHRGLRPFGSTFLVFSDYLRPAVRMAALMRLPVIFVFTHDSIGLGEDGPTHQPVEHLTALRAIPNLAVLRPADANETAQAWRVALARTDGPSALVLSRQGLPVLPPAPDGAVTRAGAWIVRDPDADPDVVLIATGSEVSLALAAAEDLHADGIAARVVSMPWRERFLALDPRRAEEILPTATPRVAVEAGLPDPWLHLVGDTGEVVALRRFGASAPGEEVMAQLGMTASAVRAAARCAAGRDHGEALDIGTEGSDD